MENISPCQEIEKYSLNKVLSMHSVLQLGISELSIYLFQVWFELSSA